MAGDYSVFYFVPGAGGYVEAELYSDYLSLVASHGFIVIGTDLIFPAVSHQAPASPTNIALQSLKANQSEQYIEQYRWMEQNLQSRLNARKPGIQVMWNYTALGSHSSGADVTRQVLTMNHTIAQAVVFLEPVSLTFDQPINFSEPALMYEAELSEQHKSFAPACVTPGFGYERFYRLWTPTKVLIEAKGYGHCAILDNIGYQVCKSLGICVTGNHTDLNLYKTFVQGLTSAFLVSTMLGYNDSIQYVIDQSKVPVTYLQDKYEFK